MTTHHRILLVDDNDDVREMSADMLRELGYCVVQAANGEEALERLAKLPRFDVMVTDVLMPGMSGLELFERVSTEHVGLPVVLISGYLAPQALRCRLVRKPFRTAELDSAIREALAS